MGVAAILGLSVLVGANYLRFRDPLYPPVIHAGWWALILIAYESFRPAVIDLPSMAKLIVFAGGLTFSAGAYLATYGYEREFASRPREVRIPSPVVSSIIFWVTFFGLFLFIARAREIAAQGPFDNFLVNIRYVTGGNSFVDEDPLEAFGPTSYLVSLSVVSIGLQFFLREYYESNRRYLVSILIATVYAVLSTGRTFILIVALVVLGLYLVTGKISAKTGIAILTIVGTAMFIVMGTLLGKGGGSGLEAVVEQFRIYLLGGLAAFGRHIQEARSLDWGANILRTPLLILQHTGISVSIPELTKEYTFVPDPTNVYTFYRPYFDDFGYVGAFLAPFFLGGVHGKVFMLARRGSAAWMLMFSLLLFPLFMQFFQDQYFSLLSTWIQYSVWTALAFSGVRELRRGDEYTAQTSLTIP